MIFPTHIKFARLIQRDLKETAGINLHLPSFIYGNIRPDIRPDYFDKNKQHKIDHYVWTSLDFITQQLRDLEPSIKSKDALQSQAFAISLGHIMHYFSDYFCYAHTKKFNQPLIKHLLYEFKLSNYFQKNTAQTVKLIKVPVIIHTSINGLITHFNSLQRDYLNQPPSMENDIKYTLLFLKTLCYSVTLGLSHNAESMSA